MPNFDDKTGCRFGRLVVLELQGSDHGRKLWLCQCDCGATKIVSSKLLMRGRTQSCGCLRSDAHRKHGQSGSPTYETWSGMLRRCLNPKHKRYKDYGGRGITVCERWLSFQNFFDDMGERPPGCDLHRKDNDKGYELGNCVWLPHSEHMRLHANQRRRNLSLAS
jgi:hypothetical protein